MRLVINEQKTKIYDLTRERMKFLGYEFFVFRQNTTNPKKKESTWLPIPCRKSERMKL